MDINGEVSLDVESNFPGNALNKCHSRGMINETEANLLISRNYY